MSSLREMTLEKKRDDLLSRVESMLNNLSNLVERSSTREQEPREQIEQIRDALLNESTARLSILVWLCVLLCVFIVSLHFTDYIQNEYRNSAIAHYRQSLMMARPYMKEIDVYLTEAEFAGLQSKEDYVKVLAKLYDILDRNGVPHHIFQAW